jgi:holo-[acyl-carrier protein] synthase
MILGTGTDIVRTERMSMLYKKYSKKLLAKILHKKEIELFNKLPISKQYSYIAKRFSAKEALVKSMGTGFNSEIFLSDICILNDKFGKPYYDVNFKLDQYIKKIFMVDSYKIHLSISDDKDYAVALSIIEKI